MSGAARVPAGPTTAAAPRRDVILWCGGAAPRDLGIVVPGRGWSLERIDRSRVLKRGSLGAARALLVEVPDAASADEFEEFALPMVDAALAEGLTVVLLMEGAGEGMHLDVERVQRFVDRANRVTLGDDPRVIRFAGAWTPVLELIADHACEAPANYDLTLTGDPVNDQNAERLLRRVFHDADQLDVEELQRGKSGAAVWSVRASGERMKRRILPFLVKFNCIDKMREEAARYRQFADETIPSWLLPLLRREGWGRAHGVLVYDFLEHATPFVSALVQYPAEQLIGALFGNTLRGCQNDAAVVTRPFVPALRNAKVLKPVEMLTEAATAARLNDAALPGAAELYHMLETLPPILHHVATAHGDLHTGNLFVRTGTTDVMLIDFGGIGGDMPVVTDAACLEVSIAFAATEVARSLGQRTAPAADAEWLRRAYMYPLDPYDVPVHSARERWVERAIRAIRGQSRLVEPHAVPHALAVALYLLRYASYMDNGTIEDRALAYELAARLVADASRDVNARAGAAPTAIQLAASGADS